MLQIKFITLAICLLTFIACIYGADKYTDENRPYEFGFTIEGEQHRHEKKDENGIIMGEFGFITADGVYHVTVYATDEQGRFKILSMKNIRVKPYPTAGVKKGHSLPFPQSENAPVVQGPSSSKPQQESKIIETKKHVASSAKSCSHCSIPSTTTKAPQLSDIAVVSRDRPAQGSLGQQENNYQQQGIPSQPNYPSQESELNNNQYGNQNVPQQGNNQYYTQNENNANNGVGNQSSPPSKNNANEYYPQELPKGAEQDMQNYPQQQSVNNYVSQASYNQPQPEEHQPTQGGTLRNPKQYSDNSPSNHENSQPQGFDAILASQNNPPDSNRPTLVAAQMQVVPKDTDIYHKRPGEREGLPNGLTKDDMNRLLYTFNYTVGFHGHHEEGYTNGAKQGYYYTTGRNGVRIRVDYVADENGFRPKISQEVLDVVSDDVPKPETEKDERFGLKGYEFKWLYYPTEAKKK